MSGPSRQHERPVSVEHQTATRLLTDIARGRLDPAGHAAVQAHVSGCAACEDLLHLARDLREESLAAGRGMFLAHPSAGVLVDFALGLPVFAQADVDSHVATCPTCSRELSLTRQASHRARAPWWETARALWFTPGSAPWRMFAASAAVVAIVLAYPAYQGMVAVPSLRQSQERLVVERDQARARGEDLARQVQEAQTSHGAGAPAWTGGVNMLVLAGTSRDADAELPRLSLRAGQTVQPVLAGFDLTRGGRLQRTIVVAIRPVASPTSVWTHRCTAREVWDAPNQIVSVLVPASVLTKGNYELTISEAAAASPAYRAPFRVDVAAR